MLALAVKHRIHFKFVSSTNPAGISLTEKHSGFSTPHPVRKYSFSFASRMQEVNETATFLLYREVIAHGQQQFEMHLSNNDIYDI
jgi:hypothetical protein